MTQLPPTLSHELEGYDTWDPNDTQTTADLRGERTESEGDASELCDAIVQRTGEPCGRELPCKYHD